MLISKQFRNFVHSVFRDCIFEVARANSGHISLAILKIWPKKCVAHLTLNLLRSRMIERERFFSKMSENCLFRHKCFCWKIACYKVLQSLQLCIPQQLLQRKMFCINIVIA